MKKFLFILLILFTQILNAEPYLIEGDFWQQKNYAIDLIVRKQPLKYKVYDDTGKLAKAVPLVYKSLFAQLQYLLRNNNQQDLKQYKEIIAFGASDSAYIPSDEPDITFYITTENYSKYCSNNSLGCFKFNDNNKMQIAVHTFSEEMEPVQLNVLTHEIGHSLRLKDLYFKDLAPVPHDYGNGARYSVMNNSLLPTCDDFEGLLNTIYLVLKNDNPSQKEVQLPAFCQDAAKTANALPVKETFIKNLKDTAALQEKFKDKINLPDNFL